MGIEIALTVIGFGVTAMAGAVTYLAWKNGKIIKENTEKIIRESRENTETILKASRENTENILKALKESNESILNTLTAMREDFKTLGEKTESILTAIKISGEKTESILTAIKTLGEKMDEGFRLIALLILSETPEEKRRIAEKIISKS